MQETSLNATNTSTTNKTNENVTKPEETNASSESNNTISKTPTGAESNKSQSNTNTTLSNQTSNASSQAVSPTNETSTSNKTSSTNEPSTRNKTAITNQTSTNDNKTASNASISEKSATLPTIAQIIEKIAIFQNKTFLDLPVDFNSLDADLRENLKKLMSFIDEIKNENVNKIYNNILNTKSNKNQRRRRILYVNSGNNLTSEILSNKKYYLIYDDLLSRLNSSILISDDKKQLQDTFCVIKPENILFTAKQIFDYNKQNENAKEKLFNNILSLFLEAENAKAQQNCQEEDFLLLSQFDSIAINSTKTNNTENQEKENSNFASFKDKASQIITYCLNCPEIFAQYSIRQSNANSTDTGQKPKTGNFTSESLRIEVFDIVKDIFNDKENSISQISQENKAQALSAAEETNTNKKHLKYFYLASGCLNKLPFSFVFIKSNSSSNLDNPMSFISYSYDKISLNERCMTRSFECLHKQADKNLTFCATDYMAAECAKNVQLFNKCKIALFNYKLNLNNTSKNGNSTTNQPSEERVGGFIVSKINKTKSEDSNLNFASIMNTMKQSKHISLLAYFCDFANYMAGNTLYKNLNSEYKKLLENNIAKLKQQIKNINLNSTNPKVYDVIMNYNYTDYYIYDSLNNTLYQKYLKFNQLATNKDKQINFSDYFNISSYSQTQANLTNANVNNSAANSLRNVSESEFKKEFAKYLDSSKQNIDNLYRGYYLTNCFGWINKNFIQNSINLNQINLANYSNVVINDNFNNYNVDRQRLLESENSQENFLKSNEALSRILQSQSASSNFELVESDPTQNDTVVNNFEKKVNQGYQNSTNKMKDLVSIDGSSPNKTANYSNLVTNLNSTNYFAKINSLNESEYFGNRTSNFNENLVTFYENNNQSLGNEQLNNTKPANQTSITMSSSFVNIANSVVLYVFIFVVIFLR